VHSSPFYIHTHARTSLCMFCLSVCYRKEHDPLNLHLIKSENNSCSTTQNNTHSEEELRLASILSSTTIITMAIPFIVTNNSLLLSLVLLPTLTNNLYLVSKFKQQRINRHLTYTDFTYKTNLGFNTDSSQKYKLHCLPKHRHIKDTLLLLSKLFHPFLCQTLSIVSPLHHNRLITTRSSSRMTHDIIETNRRNNITPSSKPILITLTTKQSIFNNNDNNNNNYNYNYSSNNYFKNKIATTKLPSRASTPIRFQTTITTADISAASVSMALPEAIHSSNENYVPIFLRNILLYGNYFLITGYDFKYCRSRRHVFFNKQVDWREIFKKYVTTWDVS